ncbi:MAG: type II secretion system F family protein [Candidatus Altiarchaeota archaeon]|nr:type II secretion system F family protein [Candidatus Altiarchaeota archaeon]
MFGKKQDKKLEKLFDENLDKLKKGGAPTGEKVAFVSPNEPESDIFASMQKKPVEGGKKEVESMPAAASPFSKIKQKFSEPEPKKQVEVKAEPPKVKSESKFMKSVLEEKLKQQTKEKLPTPSELEEEWDKKLRDAQKRESGVPRLRKGGVGEESIEDVFARLKETGGAPTVAQAKGDERLDKIRGVIRGEAPDIGKRELTGEKIPFLYRIYSIGQLPPLNLLSKMYSNSYGKNLETSLEITGVPLYPYEYCSFAVAMGFILSLSLFILFFVLMSYNIVLPLLFMFLSLIAVSFFLLLVPVLKVKSSSRDIDKQLPFALRHMSSLLTAGISIFDTLVSVSKADYGALSAELDQVVWNVKSGESLSDALEESSRRVNSKAYNRVVVHIRRALQMGGDIAEIIAQIADDMTFEMRMQISDFVEKLNAFSIIYLVGGIVGPVVISIFSIIQVLPMYGGGGSTSMTAVLLLLVFPLMMGLIIYMVKMMEPKV